MSNERKCVSCPRLCGSRSKLGLCAACYMRYYRNGKCLPATPSKRSFPKAIPTCHPEEPYGGKGLCAKCYAQQYRTVLRGGIEAKPYAQIPTCHPERKHHVHGLCYECWVVSDKRKIQYRAKVSDPVYKEQLRHQQRTNKLKRHYGITPEEYERLLQTQNGVCALCQTEKPAKNALPVDHDHVTGKVRGILCIPCNRALGYFENTAWRARAEAYLYQPRV